MPRLGYRLVAPVSPWVEQTAVPAVATPAPPDGHGAAFMAGRIIERSPLRIALAAGAVVCLSIAYLSYRGLMPSITRFLGGETQMSVAVLRRSPKSVL